MVYTLFFLTCFPFIMDKEIERSLEKSTVGPADFKLETLSHKPSTLYLGHQALGSRDGNECSEIGSCTTSIEVPGGMTNTY